MCVILSRLTSFCRQRLCYTIENNWSKKNFVILGEDNKHCVEKIYYERLLGDCTEMLTDKEKPGTILDMF